VGQPAVDDQDIWKAILYESLAEAFLKEASADSARIYIEKAEEHLMQARTSSPQAARLLSRSAALLRVELLLLEDKIEEALTACENIPPIEVVPFDPAYFLIYNFPMEPDAAARTLVAAGRIDGAIAAYEALTTFDPAGKDRRLVNPRNHCRLARLYEQVGRREDAAAHYERFLDMFKEADPGDGDVEDAVRRLAALKRES
jgi:tetratricopeptide (TPR) repeat protein